MIEYFLLFQQTELKGNKKIESSEMKETIRNLEEEIRKLKEIQSHTPEPVCDALNLQTT